MPQAGMKDLGLACCTFLVGELIRAYALVAKTSDVCVGQPLGDVAADGSVADDVFDPLKSGDDRTYPQQLGVAEALEVLLPTRTAFRHPVGSWPTSDQERDNDASD